MALVVIKTKEEGFVVWDDVKKIRVKRFKTKAEAEKFIKDQGTIRANRKWNYVIIDMNSHEEIEDRLNEGYEPFSITDKKIAMKLAVPSGQGRSNAIN